MALIDKASLLMVPSTYEDGTLYNVLPSGNKAPDETGNHNGYDQTRADFTFSRGSNLAATRVNANGLIEKGRENVVLHSNSFDNAAWTKTNSSVTSGQTGYDGSSNAWKIDIASAFAQVEQVVSNSGVQTFSVYAKAGTLNWVRLRVDHTTFSGTYFDLQNGVVGSTASDIDSTIEDLGGGWYRCSISVNYALTRVRIYPAIANNDLTATSGSIYIQDAQLELGLVSTPVIRTGATTATAGVLENTPRIDYSSGAGALLLESQRTNTISKSEYISSYSSGGGAGLTMTANYGISPEGVKNSTRIQYTSGNSYVYSNYATATASGQSFTISIYAKGVAGEQIRLHASGSSGISFNKEFTLSGEWQRFDATGTTGSAGQVLPHILVGYGSSNPATDFEVYGWQCEQASHVSSYVPTYGSAATRGADLCNSGGSAESINSTEGVLYAEISGLSNDTARLSISDGTNNNNIYIELDSSNVNAVGRVGGSNQFALSSSQTITNNNKVAVKYKANDFALYVNGTEVATDTSGSTYSANTLTSIQFNRGDGGVLFYGNVKQVAVFNEALTDAECVTLTTL